MAAMINAVTKKPVVYAPNVPAATSGDITKSGIKNPPAFNNVATIPDAPPIHSGPISGSSTNTFQIIVARGLGALKVDEQLGGKAGIEAWETAHGPITFQRDLLAGAAAFSPGNPEHPGCRRLA